MSLSTEREIQDYYSDRDVARAYVENRFKSEVHLLLHDRQVAAVQELVDRDRPAWILEIAPGPGRLTRSIRPSGGRVCVEFNQSMIEEGRAACSASTGFWVRGNGFQLPFEQTFDLAHTFRFIRHFRPGDRERLYRELGRVLKPRAWLVFDAVNEHVSGPLRQAHPDDFPIYDALYSERELRDELSAAGFESIELIPVQKYYRLQLASQTWIGPRASWLNRAIVRGLERSPRRDGLEWIVRCRRA